MYKDTVIVFLVLKYSIIIILYVYTLRRTNPIIYLFFQITISRFDIIKIKPFLLHKHRV